MKRERLKHPINESENESEIVQLIDDVFIAEIYFNLDRFLFKWHGTIIATEEGEMGMYF